MSNQELIDNMEAVWRSITALCSDFTEEQWKTPTDCPGWSVQDQLSHLVGAETRLLGHPLPAYTPQDVSHVKNETGQSNEVLVDWRRPKTGAQVLAEFREMTGQRMSLLRTMTDADFAEKTDTPIGLAPVSEQVAIRIFDAWVHEQDVRRALGRPGGLDGPVAEHSMGRIAMAMPYIVGRKVQPPDGSTVVLDITGAAGRRMAIGMDGGRAAFLDEIPASPTAKVTMAFETYACLACGRWEPAEVLDTDLVQIDGDQSIGRAFVEQLNFMI
jgi:uncharacterized protein (TIGR03083 family)